MYEQIAANKRRTVVLVAGFILILAAAGAAVGLIIGYGWWGAAIAFVISGILAFASYWKSDAVALAVSRAQPADPNTYKRLYNLVEGLTIASGLPMPRIYIVDDPAPNAFATGRNPRHAAIAVTTGLLEKMNRVELEGVLAHELSHVKNYDILISTIAVERRPRTPPRRSPGPEQPAGAGRVRVHHPRPDPRQGDAGGGEPQPRDVG